MTAYCRCAKVRELGSRLRAGWTALAWQQLEQALHGFGKENCLFASGKCSKSVHDNAVATAGASCQMERGSSDQLSIRPKTKTNHQWPTTPNSVIAASRGLSWSGASVAARTKCPLEPVGKVPGTWTRWSFFLPGRRCLYIELLLSRSTRSCCSLQVNQGGIESDQCVKDLVVLAPAPLSPLCLSSFFFSITVHAPLQVHRSCSLVLWDHCSHCPPVV